jgi:hypothetical protein
LPPFETAFLAAEGLEVRPPIFRATPQHGPWRGQAACPEEGPDQLPEPPRERSWEAHALVHDLEADPGRISGGAATPLIPRGLPGAARTRTRCFASAVISQQAQPKRERPGSGCGRLLEGSPAAAPRSKSDGLLPLPKKKARGNFKCIRDARGRGKCFCTPGQGAVAGPGRLQSACSIAARRGLFPRSDALAARNSSGTAGGLTMLTTPMPSRASTATPWRNNRML